MTDRYNPDLIQKIKVLRNVTLQGGGVLPKGTIVDRDGDRVRFEAIVRSGAKLSLPGGRFEVPNSPFEIVERRIFEAEPAEVWVSPDGDDENPGTKDKPFRTIAKAQEYLLDLVGDKVMKVVRLRSGSTFAWATYDPIFINSPLWRFIGEDRMIRPFIEPKVIDGYEMPPVVITNMSREAFDDYMREGGPNIEMDPDLGTWIDLGATLEGRETTPYDIMPSYMPSDTYWEGFMYVDFRNISLSPTNTGFHLISAPVPFRENGVAFNSFMFINFMDVHWRMMEVSGDQNPSILLRKFRQVKFGGIETEINTVWVDLINSDWVAIENFRKDLGHDLSLRVAYNKDEVRRGGSHTDLGDHGLDSSIRFRDFELYSNSDGNNLGTNIRSMSAYGWFRTYGTYAIGLDNNPLEDARARNFDLRSSGHFLAAEVKSVQDFVKSGTGRMDIGRIDVGGNCSISGGTDNKIGSGYFAGDLTVSSGCALKLRNSTIEGNLTVQTGAHIDFVDVTVIGDTDVTGAGDIRWAGGKLLGDVVDPDGKLPPQE